MNVKQDQAGVVHFIGILVLLAAAAAILMFMSRDRELSEIRHRSAELELRLEALEAKVRVIELGGETRPYAPDPATRH